MYEVRKMDPSFAAAWDDAIEQGTDALEHEARRRALHGTERPVFHNGKQCGFVKEYSDMLLIKLLTAYRGDKFKERSAVETTGKGGGPIEVAAEIHPAARALIDKLKADIYGRKEAQAKGDDGTQDLSPVTPESIE